MAPAEPQSENRREGDTVELAARRLLSLDWGLYTHLGQVGCPERDLRALRVELETLGRLVGADPGAGRPQAPVIPGQMSICDIEVPL